ncbi:hypothetical protein ACLB2K_044901 [Fragaria x ananassa]
MKEELIKEQEEMMSIVADIFEGIKRTDDQVSRLWGKMESHSETIQELKDIAAKLNAIVVDKVLCNKDNSSEGNVVLQRTLFPDDKLVDSIASKFPTLKTGGQIVLNVTPPNAGEVRPHVNPTFRDRM